MLSIDTFKKEKTTFQSTHMYRLNAIHSDILKSYSKSDKRISSPSKPMFSFQFELEQRKKQLNEEKTGCT